MTELAPDENVLARVGFQPDLSRANPFTCVWTDRNVYWSRIDFVTGATKFDRIPHADIRRVVVRRVRTIGTWIAAPLLVIFGGVFSFLTLVLPFFVATGDTVEVSAYPLGILAAGIALPFISRGRYEIRLVLTNGRAPRWRMPLVIGSKARGDVRKIIDDLTRAAEASSLHVEKPDGFQPLELQS